MGKGSDNERRLCKAYQRAYWWTYSPANVRYGDNDLFNLFDMVAFCPRTLTLDLVQCKTNRASGINDWFHDASPFSRTVTVNTRYAVRHDSLGWRLAGPTESGYSWLYDGRSSDAKIGEGLTDYLRGETE